MASNNYEALASIIRRYVQVAELVNQREVQRFTDTIRQRWNPDYECEPELRGEGYTSAGAFTACVYEAAFINWEQTLQLSPIKQRADRQLCEAERLKQVQFSPSVEELVDWLPKPLADPLPPSERIEKLKILKAKLQQQLDASGTLLASPLELPEDVVALYAATNGIGGAGVESETDGLQLIYSMASSCGCASSKAESIPFDVTSRAPLEMGRLDANPVAAWKMGGNNQHRSIYYVLYQVAESSSAALTTWKIFDQIDVEVYYYESIARLLQHETESVEKEEGGARLQHIILYDDYPIYESY